MARERSKGAEHLSEASRAVYPVPLITPILKLLSPDVPEGLGCKG